MYGSLRHDTSGSFSRTKSSSAMVRGKIMFRVCCNDYERNRERVHSELYSLGTVCMCHAVWRNYMHMAHCSKSSGLCVCVCNNNCSPGPPYHGRKVGCDLEGNARVVDATGSWSYIPGSLCVNTHTQTHTHTHTHTHERLTTHIAV